MPIITVQSIMIFARVIVHAWTLLLADNPKDEQARN